MPVSPTIINAPAGLAVTCPFVIGGVTYQQILQSLGTYVYGAGFIYLAATNYAEINQAVFYNHFNAFGDSVSEYLPFQTDPYQSQPSIYYEGDEETLIFDGFSSMTFNVQPNSTVFLKFYMTINYMGSPLEMTQANAFKMFEKAEGIDFFNEYCDYLIDDETGESV
jgi:hypothetical protein